MKSTAAPLPGTYRFFLEMADDNAKKKKYHRTALSFRLDGKAAQKLSLFQHVFRSTNRYLDSLRA